MHGPTLGPALGEAQHWGAVLASRSVQRVTHSDRSSVGSWFGTEATQGPALGEALGALLGAELRTTTSYSANRDALNGKKDALGPTR
jgi:hypothetical protein